MATIPSHPATAPEMRSWRTRSACTRPPSLDSGHDAPTCATCGTLATPSDTFCAECGTPFGEPAPVADVAPVATPYALAADSAKNQERIPAQCPHASDVRGFHAWLNAGRVVRKGQKGIKIVAPVIGGEDGGRVVNIKPAYVFDVSQTDERAPRTAVAA